MRVSRSWIAVYLLGICLIMIFLVPLRVYTDEYYRVPVGKLIIVLCLYTAAYGALYAASPVIRQRKKVFLIAVVALCAITAIVLLGNWYVRQRQLMEWRRQVEANLKWGKHVAAVADSVRREDSRRYPDQYHGLWSFSKERKTRVKTVADSILLADSLQFFSTRKH